MQEARKDLATFLTYCRDEAEFTLVTKLYQEAGGTADPVTGKTYGKP
jgi:hypothetical protein